MFPRSLVQRNRDGTFTIHLSEVEREVVSGICGELRVLLTEDPDATIARRLFPKAYEDDAEQERFYQQMNRGDLVESRLAALELVERTVDARTVTRAELDQWMTAINAARLTLGTALEITEEPFELEPDDQNIGYRLSYELLSILLAGIVRAIAES